MPRNSKNAARMTPGRIVQALAALPRMVCFAALSTRAFPRGVPCGPLNGGKHDRLVLSDTKFLRGELKRACASQALTSAQRKFVFDVVRADAGFKLTKDTLRDKMRAELGPRTADTLAIHQICAGPQALSNVHAYLKFIVVALGVWFARSLEAENGCSRTLSLCPVARRLSSSLHQEHMPPRKRRRFTEFGCSRHAPTPSWQNLTWITRRRFIRDFLLLKPEPPTSLSYSAAEIFVFQIPVWPSRDTLPSIQPSLGHNLDTLLSPWLPLEDLPPSKKSSSPPALAESEIACTVNTRPPSPAESATRTNAPSSLLHDLANSISQRPRSLKSLG